LDMIIIKHGDMMQIMMGISIKSLYKSRALLIF